jgi:hypothetical protein
MLFLLEVGIDQRSVDDGPRDSGHIRHRIRTPSHRISPVLLLEHSNDDDVIGGIDPEPGSVNAAPVESARTVRAAVEIGPSAQRLGHKSRDNLSKT